MIPRPFVLRLLVASLLAFAAIPLTADEPGVHAITGVRIVPSPGSVVEEGTVVLRNGVIEAMGADVTPPPDARIWEPEGVTVYPGFIDAYGTRPWPALEAEKAAPPQDGHPNDWVRPERDMARYGLEPERAEALRKAGFTLAVVAPKEGLFRGSGVLTSLTDGALPEQIVASRVTQNVTLRGRGFAALFGDGETYPTSTMGAAALFRQVLLDVGWQRRAQAAYAGNPAQERPPTSRSLEALEDAVAGRLPMVFETISPVETLRVLRLAEEMEITPWLVGHGREPERLAELAQADAPVLLPVDFPEPPEVGEDDDRTVGLEELRRWYWAPETPKRLLDAGVTTALTAHGLDDPAELHAQLARSIERGLSRDAALAALTTTPARLLGLADRTGTLEPGKMANLVLVRGDLFAEDTEIVETWVEGRRFAQEPPKSDAASSGTNEEPAKSEDEKDEKRKKARTENAPADDLPPAPAPLRPSLPEQLPTVLVQGATIWTAGPEGTLEDADLLIQDGRVAAVGRGLDAPAEAVVVDGSGLHVTPGLVDAHSHTAMEDTNEVGDLITSEVRVSDGLDFTDVNLYRQLAGGLTTANVLHGSANPVGGQSAVIKLRWGATDQGLLVDDAEPTIKLALGENPKRSNAPGNHADHFPRSRPGVEQAIRDRFLEARDYAREWDAWENDPDPDRVPPRRDLELEALAEILAGERRIHSHSYRADEILMLLELARDLDLEPPVFQHGLEAYKVADELAAAGASASIFSDWWGYKFEVVDAIPFSGALLTERGVLTSFNSDSDELARRLNLEAAKGVRYGGMAPEEALKLVTAYPARQLGLDHRIGTLEPGKDGDFVIWSGDPLSTYSRVLETWIEGRKFFDREDDLKRRETLLAERQALLERARAAGDGENNKGSESGRTR